MSPDVVFYPNPLTNTSDARDSADLRLVATLHQEAEPAEATDVEASEGVIFGTSAEDDEELMRLVGTGSKAAISVLFQKYAQKVFHVACRILKDDSEAEDLMQDVFVFIFQKGQLFDSSKGSAISWIIQITYHRAIDRRRFLSARRHYIVGENDPDQQAAVQGRISIDDVAGRAILNKFQQELTAEQRDTLELHFFEGYTFHEIAERTGQGFGNVRHHYYRGLERLRSFVFPGKKRQK